ncbi:MAG: hypothetical protein IT373_34825 [Polyangiaceae bacterium]|nr:hypothetical protein [Polyangiaceae bacterium]
MPILRGILPGALMYQVPVPAGVLPADPPRSGQFHALEEASCFADIPESELSAVLASIAKTYARSHYHEYRFKQLRSELDQHRAVIPHEIVWDSLVEPVHFELQAFTGACRTLLDELVYLIARRHGVPPNRARKKPWETADLLKEPLPSECDVEEIRVLRSMLDWFDTLNAFRNSFFHHGWRHGGGHFSAEDLRRATGFPSRNGLLVPDRESLVGRKKPFEWSWSKGTTVDDVARAARTGTEELAAELFDRIWQTPIPAPGTAPLDERPNMLVGLVRPVLVQTRTAIILPYFSTRERGQGCRPLCDDPDLELVDVQPSEVVVGKRDCLVSLAGIENNTFPPSVTHVEAQLDPIASVDWTTTKCATQRSIAIAEVLKQGSIAPISMPVTELDRIWVWRRTTRPYW